MSQNSNQTVTTETLKALTNAPSVDEPLVSQDAFKDREVHSDRPVWKTPVVKLTVIGAALVPIFGLAGYFLVGGKQLNQPERAQNPFQPDVADPEPDLTLAEELEQLRRENAALKASSALDGQEYLLAQQDSPQPQLETRRAEAPPDNAQPAVTAVRPIPPATSVSHRPSPAPIQSVRPSVSVDHAPNRPVNPVQQWRQLAQLGSYGSITPPEALPLERTPVPTSEFAVPQAVLVASTDPMPTARIAPTSAVQVSTNPLPSDYPVSAPLSSAPVAPAPEVLEEETTITLSEEGPVISVEEVHEILGRTPTPEDLDSSPVFSTHPSILVEAESAILENRPLLRSLIAGTHSAGQLATPLILDNPNGENRFIVVSAEPITDNQGKVAIPAGSQFLVKVDSFSDNGLVELSATEVIWEEAGRQKEILLPDQVILIRGEDGEPLMAEEFDDKSGELMARNAQQFLFGAIRRSAELYSLSDTRIQTGDGTTIITEDNPEPNILAGALEGGTEAVLDIITERNRQAIKAIENRPSIRFVEMGRSVQVFVNQSMQMPI